ncbi:MAG: Rieske (2Fe-2S) protein [Pseudomonadota bacterium]
MTAASNPTPWVPVALTCDLPAGGVMRAQAAGHDLAVWRAHDDTVHCVDNRCPHRGMRLSFGFVRGNRLNCLYHGWQYGTSGACQYIPAHPELEPPVSLCVSTFPCCEAGGLVWISFLPDTAPLPDAAAGTPLRSLAVDAPHDSVQHSLVDGELPDTRHPRTGCALVDRTPGPVHSRLTLQPAAGDAVTVQVTLQAVTDLTCVLHTQLTTTAPAAARVAASRWLEALRRTLETPA